jgi:hypothetical protein
VIDIFKKRDYFGITLFFAILGILVWYFAAKLQIFDKLGYQSDLYTHLEISRGWLQNRPLMHENCYGYHHKLHNYFFNPLMGPLTVRWGAYGIFITQFVLYLLALAYTFPIIYKVKKDDTFNHKLSVAVFYITIVLGPFSFWMYDNPHYGFHPELVYIPLGLIFAVSLFKNQRWVSVPAAILMLTVREDGAVVVACIQLLYFVLQWVACNITRKQWLLRSALWGAVWVVVFVAGIIYLKKQNAEGGDRLSEALGRIKAQNPEDIKAYFKGIFLHFSKLLLPFVLFIVYLRVINYKAALAFVIFLLPIIAVNIISGFVYFPAQYFSLTWTPRFSLTFTLLLAFGAYSLLLFSKPWFRPAFVNFLLALAIGYYGFKWQKKLLHTEVEYSYQQQAIKIFKEQHPQTYYHHWDSVRRVARVLPPMYPVAPPNKLFGYFHKQDVIWTNRVKVGWVLPRMIICDETNSTDVIPQEVLTHPDSLITPNMRYYFEAEDRHYLIEAGIAPKDSTVK